MVASKGGADTSPAWYFNILADSNVKVEYGSETFAAEASIAEGAEREELYGKMEGIFAGFTEYKTKTERVMPVVVLSRK